MKKFQTQPCLKSERTCWFFSRSIHHRHFVFFFQEFKLRGSALVALGKLCQKLPEAVTKDMAIIQMLFNAMATVYKLIFSLANRQFYK
jgi:hypothetical protein